MTKNCDETSDPDFVVKPKAGRRRRALTSTQRSRIRRQRLLVQRATVPEEKDTPQVKELRELLRLKTAALTEAEAEVKRLK